MFEKAKVPINFIIVKEGILGIETYIDENLANMHPSYKAQIVSFLEESIKVLKDDSILTGMNMQQRINEQKIPIFPTKEPTKKKGIRFQIGGDD